MWPHFATVYANATNRSPSVAVSVAISRRRYHGLTDSRIRSTNPCSESTLTTSTA